MRYEEIVALRKHSPAWRLLSADNAPLVLSFLHRVFVEGNARSVTATELTSQLDDELYALNERLGEGTFPKRAQDYLTDWARPEAGWLRKYYPAGAQEAHFDATPAVEKALSWIRSLEARSFVGTESRLNTVFELLRQIVYGAEDDPDVRGGRLVGVNELPGRLWVDSYDQLWSALGKQEPAEWFAAQVATARAETPRLVEWLLRHPLRVLENRPQWSRLAATVQWIDTNLDGSQYLRQVDVPGVDTKFIEDHCAVLAALLDAQLDPERIDQSRPRSDLAARYGFRRRPQYARLRTLDDRRPLPGGFSELTVQLGELAAAPVRCETVYVIENEVSYLAFPPVDGAVAVFGGGYAVTVLEQLGWLADRELIYWGDIDTHGLRILDRLRQRFPRTRSLLMDRATLLAHEGQWAQEATPHLAHLAHLWPAESELYRDLVEQTFGPRVRLEQERVSYAAVAAAALQGARTPAARSQVAVPEYGGMTEYRASFDADVTFLNGGGLQVQGFRLDLPGRETSEEELAGLLVGHLGLLMVDQVRLSHIEVLAEAHKGSRGGPAAAAASAGAGESRRLVDLSHPIEAGMTTYPGLPGPEISPFVSRADSRRRYAEGTEFAIDRITMVGNTGTYVDSPFHRYEGGVDLAGLPLASLADLPVVVVRLTGSGERAITAQTLAPYAVSGAAVLLHTGWDRHWRTDSYGLAAPFLTEDGARFLADAGARLVGIDSVNIDSTDGGERPAHSILLGAGIPVLEHLTNLGGLPVHGARLHAVPAPVRDFGTFPVRAYAVV